MSNIFRVGDRVVDRETDEPGVIVWKYTSDPHLDHVVAVKFDRNPPVAVHTDDLRPAKARGRR